MQIDFLYYEDCPSHTKALARLRNVLEEEGIEVQIDVTKVETTEQAERLRFIGSPTIRVNDEDIDPPPADTPYRLACRTYHREDGRVSPLPSAEMIRHKLRTLSPA